MEENKCMERDTRDRRWTKKQALNGQGEEDSWREKRRSGRLMEGKRHGLSAVYDGGKCCKRSITSVAIASYLDSRCRRYDCRTWYSTFCSLCRPATVVSGYACEIENSIEREREDVNDMSSFDFSWYLLFDPSLSLFFFLFHFICISIDLFL